jgi:hypothetical protein
MKFKEWLYLEASFPPELLSKEIRSLLWKKNRSWKKILGQEPCLTIAHNYELLEKIDSPRAWLLRNHLTGIIVGILIDEVFAEELSGSHFAALDFTNSAHNTIKKVDTPEEAVEETEKLYHGNHPMRIGTYQASLALKVYLNFEP